MTRNAALVLGIAAAVAIGGLPVASADAVWAADAHEQPKKSVSSADVYYGDAARWQKPAEVDPDAVYAKIDEYKEIVDQGLKPGDAKYEILIGKASKRFTCAVKKAAKDGKYDLVARTGAVKGVGDVPDITTEVVAKL